MKAWGDSPSIPLEHERPALPACRARGGLRYGADEVGVEGVGALRRSCQYGNSTKLVLYLARRQALPSPTETPQHGAFWSPIAKIAYEMRTFCLLREEVPAMYQVERQKLS